MSFLPAWAQDQEGSGLGEQPLNSYQAKGPQRLGGCHSKATPPSVLCQGYTLEGLGSFQGEGGGSEAMLEMPLAVATKVVTSVSLVTFGTLQAPRLF